MAPGRHDRSVSGSVLGDADPQRCGRDDAAVLEDDRLIESIRTGRITETDAADPLVALLVRWRRSALAGP